MTNKELTPQERIIYVRQIGVERSASIRIGAQVFSSMIDGREFLKYPIEWNAACDAIVRSCRQSASFYEKHGVEYHSAPKELQKKGLLPEDHIDYPVKYILHVPNKK